MGLFTEQNERLAAERDAWKEIARQAQENCDYYRSLVVRIGEVIGEEAYKTDTGEVVPDVLCAKVPDLVQEMKDDFDQLVDDLEQDRMDRNLLD